MSSVEYDVIIGLEVHTQLKTQFETVLRLLNGVPAE
jgi:Asp-tRNA(Asn)/Glu-tRNA(Gln) amidotransferase B subunit